MAGCKQKYRDPKIVEISNCVQGEHDKVATIQMGITENRHRAQDKNRKTKICTLSADKNHLQQYQQNQKCNPTPLRKRNLYSGDPRN